MKIRIYLISSVGLKLHKDQAKFSLTPSKNCCLSLLCAGSSTAFFSNLHFLFTSRYKTDRVVQVNYQKNKSIYSVIMCSTTLKHVVFSLFLLWNNRLFIVLIQKVGLTFKCFRKEEEKTFSSSRNQNQW